MIVPIKRRMPRVQRIIMPVLKDSLEEYWPGINVVSWYPKADSRDFPLITLRRVSGLAVDPQMLDRPVLEYTAYTSSRSGGSYPDTEQLCMDVREVIVEMVKRQVVIPNVGYIHRYFETYGPTQFDSPFDDSWRVQGLIQLSIRPVRKEN